MVCGQFDVTSPTLLVRVLRAFISLRCFIFTSFGCAGSLQAVGVADTCSDHLDLRASRLTHDWRDYCRTLESRFDHVGSTSSF